MRRSLQLSLFAVVLLALVGGSLAILVAQKSVTLTVDGQARQVTTYAGTVAEVLVDEGLQTEAHDVVLPALDAPITDGDAVVLNRARPLLLTVDGVAREVHVTALSVDEALEQLGYRSDELVLSASRSERLPLGGLELTITTPKDVTLVADGRTRVVTTTAATAGDLLAEQGITLAATDRTSLYPTQGLLPRMTLQVFRVRIGEQEVRTAIEHERVETPDPDAFTDEETVTQQGVDGEKVTRYRVTVVDGTETERIELSTEVTREPVEERVTVGTKKRPQLSPSADGLNWAALAECESGGRPNAVSSTGAYRGMYQFSQSTWEAVGGSGDPAAASPAEQTARAQQLYQRSGAGQWPHCGPNLFR